MNYTRFSPTFRKRSMTKRLTHFSLVLFMWVIPFVSFAQLVPATDPSPEGPPDIGLSSGVPVDRADVVLRIINYVLAIAGIVALLSIFVAIPYGIYVLITSKGVRKRIIIGVICILFPFIAISAIGIAAALANFIVRGFFGGVPTGVV